MRKLFILFLICVLLKINTCVYAETALVKDFKLADTQGNSISFSSYREKSPMLLFFWTMRCPFCQSELRLLNQLYPQLSADGVKLLTIDAGEDPERVKRFVQRMGLKYKVLLDEDYTAVDLYGVLGVPTYILINKENQVVFQDNSFPQNYRDLIAK